MIIVQIKTRMTTFTSSKALGCRRKDNKEMIEKLCITDRQTDIVKNQRLLFSQLIPLKLPKFKYFVGVKLVFFIVTEREVDKKGEKKVKGVEGKFSP